ncbi:hypothetical protein [Serratia fonticola]|uniref:hypothetical protein n=1 Tax=Serratia fonticola TaxID=47917 RepID=UPI001AE4EBE4|nr:hypothetical protein [Serratia fonticola]MBP0999899.1 hypothetical protein [Serratia fonticola]MBP1004274.1 hypothetical protein [Serratia fonticola]MBP1014266.1 hypothetical protein [Serratia fonticola]
MSYISGKYLAMQKQTTFKLANGKPAASLSVKLYRDDFDLIIDLINRAYHAGEVAGSEQRAAEIREALGLECNNCTNRA